MMPNFIMQCFLLPKRVCKDLSSVIRKFWWGSKEGENKISWVNWNKLCDSKLQGGLGFHDFHDFNLAFLAKQGWRLVNGPGSLFQRLFKGKYFHSSSFWEASCPKSASWAWWSICAGRTVLRKGWRWCVRDGKAISIWCDPWLPRSLNFRVLSPAPRTDSLYHSVTWVSDLIDEVTHSWNIPLIKTLFSDIDVEAILSIPISSQSVLDKGVWHYTENGLFSVKSAYHLTRSSNIPHNSRERGESSSGSLQDGIWRLIWSL